MEPEVPGDRGQSNRQKKRQQQELHHSQVKENYSAKMLDFSAEELMDMQQRDVSLKKIRERLQTQQVLGLFGEEH